MHFQLFTIEDLHFFKNSSGQSPFIQFWLKSLLWYQQFIDKKHIFLCRAPWWAFFQPLCARIFHAPFPLRLNWWTRLIKSMYLAEGSVSFFDSYCMINQKRFNMCFKTVVCVQYHKQISWSKWYFLDCPCFIGIPHQMIVASYNYVPEDVSIRFSQRFLQLFLVH